MRVISESLAVLVFFFFSSRRRHTRYWRDWSSDVCSSDLEHRRGEDQDARVRRVRRQPAAVADAHVRQPEAHAAQRLAQAGGLPDRPGLLGVDRKSTRLNSSHANISYAVFCLKKKKTFDARVDKSTDQ